MDADQSIIEWAGRNPNTRHTGTVSVSKGDINVKDGAIQGGIDIDMTSIRNINLEGDPLQPVLVSHLESDDFFFVKIFPTARFEIRESRVEKEPFLSSPNVEFKGLLSLRGVKAELGFWATVTQAEENGLIANANFDIDRTRWNIIYGSTRFFEHLGMHLVFDMISLQLKIVAHRLNP
ncbi:MAG: YceI family protein [Deltaproteobacteria bacterium]|nr:YceI family protein [Deltaproteobacteria bacterium]